MRSLRCLCRRAGGKLVYQLAKKKTSHPTCPISGQRLNGVSLLLHGSRRISDSGGGVGKYVSSLSLASSRRQQVHLLDL